MDRLAPPFQTDMVCEWLIVRTRMIAQAESMAMVFKDFLDVSGARASFEAGAQAWDDYVRTPHGKLRQDLILYHLLRHLGSTRPLRVLDAGAGTGAYSWALAQVGHHVTLVDYSSPMLEIARQRFEQSGQLYGRAEFLHAPVDELSERLPHRRCDLLLVHTLLEYLPEPEHSLEQLVAMTTPGALVSLVLVNPHSDVMRLGARQHDPERALGILQGAVAKTRLFGKGRCLIGLDRARRALHQAGVDIVAHHGIRIFADDYTPQQLANGETYAVLRKLEIAAGQTDPFRQVGRYHHLLGVVAAHPSSHP